MKKLIQNYPQLAIVVAVILTICGLLALIRTISFFPILYDYKKVNPIVLLPIVLWSGISLSLFECVWFIESILHIKVML